MGSQFSGLDAHLKKNSHLKRLTDVEHIDENDPFWNQLLSFSSNIALTKYVFFIIFFVTILKEMVFCSD
jgi:hypothetical protein